MNLQYFPHFIRKNYPDFEITNEAAIEIGEGFKSYLQDKYKGREDKLEKAWDISPIKVIMNDGHPFKTNGYEHALVIHFMDYIKLEAAKADS